MRRCPPGGGRFGLRHGLMETELYAGIIELMVGDPVAADRTSAPRSRTRRPGRRKPMPVKRRRYWRIRSGPRVVSMMPIAMPPR